MRRGLGWIAIALMLACCALALAVYGNSSGAGSIDERTLAVARDLRCPVCQGESVADSQSGISQGMRAIIRRKLQAGESTAAIRQYFVARYGNKILLAPPAAGIGGVAWLAPPLLLLGGIGLLAILIVDWRARSRLPLAAPDERYLERVRVELSSAAREGDER